MDDSNLSLLVASEKYWLQLLIDKLKPCIMEVLKEMYMQAYENAEDKNTCIIDFMEKYLKEIPHWNNISVERECNKIIKGGTSIPKLFKRIFILDIKILMVFVDDTNAADIEISVPPAIEFIHKALISCAEIAYEDAQVFWHLFPPNVYNANMEKLSDRIEEGIKSAIRDMIPEDELLSACLTSSNAVTPGNKDSNDDDKKSIGSETEGPRSVSDTEDNAPDFDLDSDDDDDNAEPESIHVNGSTGDHERQPAGASAFQHNPAANVPPPQAPTTQAPANTMPSVASPPPVVPQNDTSQDCEIESDPDDEPSE